nr:retrovirus-related Pol polyprotein from transposon TNT 1-94 [Tanacetum cinerariifolium]
MFEVKINQFLNENERLLERVLDKDILNIVVNSFVDNASVNMHEFKVLKEGQNVDLKSQDNVSDSCEQSVEIDRLKQTLSEQLKEKESLMQIVTLLKNDFKKEESRNIDREIALEKKIKHLNNIAYKRDQSAQTIHMLTKPQFFYDHTTKEALGFQNPFYLKKAQQLEPNLYDGNVIKRTSAIMILDFEETLMLAEPICSKMLLKQQDPMVLEKKFNTTPASKTKSWLWHRRLFRLNFGTTNHLDRHGLVQGLPKLKFEKEHLCSACVMGKREKKPYKPESKDTNQEKHYLLHMDLCGPMRVVCA